GGACSAASSPGPTPSKPRASVWRRWITRPEQGRCGSRQLGDQASEALHRLAHMEMSLDVPALRRNRMDHRDAEILLELVDDIEGTPGGAEHVDRLRLAVGEEDALDETIDFEA